MPTMTIDKILLLPSIDSEGFYGGELDSVKEVLARKHVDTPEYRKLFRDMDKNGQSYSIHIADGETIWQTYHWAEMVCPQEYRDTLVMGNGHHRVKIAIELGWAEMKYSVDARYTGD